MTPAPRLPSPVAHRHVVLPGLGWLGLLGVGVLLAEVLGRAAGWGAPSRPPLRTGPAG